MMTENVVNCIYCNTSLSFTGVDECASSPCLNGGACIDGAGFYTCQCLAGWQGVNCEISEKIVISSVTIFLKTLKKNLKTNISTKANNIKDTRIFISDLNCP